MKSVLTPSPILNLIPMLSPQEQSIFKSQKASNLDIQKYKNGKILFLAYIEARSFEYQSDRYKKFVQQFKQLNYVNKVLKISSLRYYRDIKSLLIGGDADGGIFQDTRFKHIKIDGIIKQLEDIAENRKVVQANIQQTDKKNRIQLEIQSPQTAFKKNDQQTLLEPQSQAKFTRTVPKGRIIKKTLTYELMQQSPQKQVMTQQVRTKSHTKNLPPQSKPKEVQIQNKNINTKPLSKYLTNKSSFQKQEQQQQKYNPSQLSFLKLIKVQESKNPHPAMKSERLYNKKQQIVQNTEEKQKNLSLKSLSKNPKLSSLQQNNLYHRRQSWGINYEKQKSQRSSIMIQTNPTPIIKNTINKNPVKQTKQLKQTKLISKSLRKSTSRQPGIIETICVKLIQCLRGLKPQNQKLKTTLHKKQQEKQLLIKKTTNIGTKTSKYTYTKKQ